MSTIDVGPTIQRLRIRKLITQRALSVAANMGHSHLNYIEKGRMIPGVSTLERISGALDVKVSDIFSGKRRRLSLDDRAFMDKLRMHIKDVDEGDRQRISRIVKQMTAK